MPTEPRDTNSSKSNEASDEGKVSKFTSMKTDYRQSQPRFYHFNTLLFSNKSHNLSSISLIMMSYVYLKQQMKIKGQ